jgi:hypothetical protein
MTRAMVVAMVAAATWGQTAAPTGSVSGVVRDAASGQPMPDVVVTLRGKDVRTDSGGRYVFRDVASGAVGIFVNPDYAANRPGVTRRVMLNAGQDLSGIDLTIRPYAEILGKVVDQNKEPVPGLEVSLVIRQYWFGALRTNITGLAATDDQGNYKLRSVEPGRAVLIVVHKRDIELRAISESPENPKLRRPAWVPTYYPGTIEIDGAQPLVLTPGEQREGIDIQVVRSQSYCIDGEARGGGTVHFQIAEPQPSYGVYGDGGTYGGLPGGIAQPDGRIRICNLHPGQYRLTAYSDENLNTPGLFGTLPVTISDRDLTRVSVSAMPRVPMTAEVVWDGAAPDTPPPAPLTFRITSLTRTELLDPPRVRIPGSARLPDLAVDDYILQFFGGVPAGAYVKDVTYGNISVLHQLLRPGTASGQATLRVVLARDGGNVRATVADKDGNPIADATVVVFPEDAQSEAGLADAMITGKTDQNGNWSTAILAPGKYLAIAPDSMVDRSPEGLARLSKMREKAQKIEVRTGGVQVMLSRESP